MAAPPTCIATPVAMEAFGQRLAGLVRPGDVINLAGSLGAGKTLLTSGLARGLAVEQQVTSPTFVVVKRYAGQIPLTHADLYRIGSIGEFLDLELIPQSADGLLVIEWGDVVRRVLPDSILRVEIVVKDLVRFVSLCGEGEWAERDLQQVTK